MNNTIFNTEFIYGKSNSTIVKIQKLSDKKYRNEYKLFLCDGIKLFFEAFDSGAEIKYIVLNNEISFSDDVINKIKTAQSRGAEVLCVSPQIFAKLTKENSPQGIITVCKYFDSKHCFSKFSKNIFETEKIMAFESVRDPGNIGTILRNATAMGIDRLIFSSDCADIYSPKVIRASMGAIFKINIDVVEDLSLTIEYLKNTSRKVLAAALDKNSNILGKYNLLPSDVIILGNEGHGISQEIISLCDGSIFIPMKENVESLNVAMASGIFMWEISK